MQKTRLYILQIIGIFVLVCGYFLSDRPDSESEMHFDLHAVHVISAVNNTHRSEVAAGRASGENKGTHKTRITKHFSFKVILPNHTLCRIDRPTLVRSVRSSFTDTYYYLYSKEINPPPPKYC